MKVRPAQAEDADAIGSIHVLSWQAAYQGLMPQDYLDRLDPIQWAAQWRQRLSAPAADGSVLVAEIDGCLLGFIAVGPCRDHDCDTAGEVRAIYLLPHAWGNGHGQQLMAAGLASLKAAEFFEVTLWVLARNVRARQFYETSGWACDGSTKRDDTRGFTLNEIRYRRQL